MSAVINRVKKVGASAWRFNYSGTGPYSIYYRGSLLEEGREEDWYIYDGLGLEAEPPALEIIDSTQSESDVATVQRPGNGILQWRRQLDANFYKVQKFVSSVWVNFFPIIIEDGRGYYQFDTGQLFDNAVLLAAPSSDLFRVIVVDGQGNESVEIEFELIGRRIPDPLEVTVTYDEITNKFTIAAV